MPAGEKVYLLDMFPYPSGAGLHVGHPLGFIGTDVLGRYQRMTGTQRAAHDGLRRVRPARRAVRGADRHPPAQDHRGRTSSGTGRSCGSWAWRTTSAARSPPPTSSSTAGPSGSSCRSSTPGTTGTRKARPIAELEAEFAAGERAHARTGAPWAELTDAEQRRVIDSHRLAYISEAPVNWCPGLGTVLANEEVTADGRSDRGNFPVFRRNLKQWMMRITAYADRLVADLDRLDWPDSVKAMQRNWIGRSEGAQVRFPVGDARDRGLHHPPGHRCSARPTWCWRPSTRWSTPSRRRVAGGRRRALDGRRAPTPAEAVAEYRAAAAAQVRPGPPGEQGQDRRLHRRLRHQPGQRQPRSRCSSPTTC